MLMAPNIWCSLCKKYTSIRHEKQHCSLSDLSTSVLNPFLTVLASPSESEDSDNSSDSSLTGGSGYAAIEVDFSRDLLDEPEDTRADIRNWLRSLPPLEIYDSECGEDQESWMIEQEGGVFRRDYGLYTLPAGTPERGIETETESVEGSDYWGSGWSFASEDFSSDLEQEESSGFDWDAFERAAEGVSAFDKMGEDFVAELGTFGMSSSSVCIVVQVLISAT